MPTFLQAYRERLEHKHGWQIELACPVCGHHSVPDYDGWTPSGAIRFGQRATIFANLSCANCGADRKQDFRGSTGIPTRPMKLGRPGCIK